MPIPASEVIVNGVYGSVCGDETRGLPQNDHTQSESHSHLS